MMHILDSCVRVEFIKEYYCPLALGKRAIVRFPGCGLDCVDPGRVERTSAIPPADAPDSVWAEFFEEQAARAADRADDVAAQTHPHLA